MKQNPTHCLQKNRNQTSGFTLVELLVVIAIIAVLVVVSLFGSRKIRDKAFQVKAINSIRQVASANLAYAAENNGEINVVRTEGETLVERRPTRGYVADSYWGRITPHLFPDVTYSSANQPKLAADIKLRLLTLHGTTDLNTMANTFQRGVPIYGGDGAGIKVPFAFNTTVAPWNKIVRLSSINDLSQMAYMTFGHYRFTETDMKQYSPLVSPRIPQRRVDFFNDRKAGMIFLDGHLEMVSPPMPARRLVQ